MRVRSRLQAHQELDPATLNGEVSPQYPDKDDPSSDTRACASPSRPTARASSPRRTTTTTATGASTSTGTTVPRGDGEDLLPPGHGRYLGVGLGVSADGETVSAARPGTAPTAAPSSWTGV